MRWQACGIALLLVGLALLPGCVDEGPADGTDGDGDDEDTYEACDALTVPFEVNGTDWEAARVECEANVTGTNEQSLSCSEPDRARLAASTNLTAGEVHLTVTGAGGETLADHRLGDTGDEGRELDVEAGQAGEWTLGAERLEGFEGSFQSELACPQ